MRLLNPVRARRAHGRTRGRATALATALSALVAGLGLLAPPAAAQGPSEPTDVAMSWGYNAYGQLGDGTTDNRSLPGDVTLPDGVRLTDVEAGAFHNLAVTSEGRVLAWGHNSQGQLGDGSTQDRSTPAEAALPDDVTVTQVAGGGEFTLALASDGRLFAWGDNAYGQLGTGDLMDHPTPVEVTLPDDVTLTQIACGREHALALTATGDVLAWGRNGNGQLGDNTTTNRMVPTWVGIPGPVRVLQVSGGWAHSMARTTTGVLAWGANAEGQLGIGPLGQQNLPVAVQLPAGITVTDIGAGAYSGVALTSEGDAYSWGHNGWGQLGNGTTDWRNTPGPVLLPEDADVTDIVVGYYHVMAGTADGGLLEWGEGLHGEVGTGDFVVYPLPVRPQLPEGLTVTDYTGGWASTVALFVPRAQGAITVRKTDAVSGDPLAGAVFRLWRETNDEPGLQPDDTPVGEGCATDDEGLCTFEGLESGSYYVEETDVPEGYKLPKDPVTGPIEVDGAGGHVNVPLDNRRHECPKGDKHC
ncbi:hypothetical protein SRB5_44870 [Streptomyces sp. RB5]|uniref:Alpha-tubulin suppressor-like RCC1 family protein n=1 Tax=Streptomyces smaragdinus TaxID=2585196 RepID=A0A7K0CM34_9ACTN|nr:SpaA isopeptide-forming pilin-related protein [Streptomyces smaragdinus]MQY14323.1 hypothetical protein [Streptomyces smaragdinus]